MVYMPGSECWGPTFKRKVDKPSMGNSRDATRRRACHFVCYCRLLLAVAAYVTFCSDTYSLFLSLFLSPENLLLPLSLFGIYTYIAFLHLHCYAPLVCFMYTSSLSFSLSYIFSKTVLHFATKALDCLALILWERKLCERVQNVLVFQAIIHLSSVCVMCKVNPFETKCRKDIYTKTLVVYVYLYFFYMCNAYNGDPCWVCVWTKNVSFFMQHAELCILSEHNTKVV